MDSLGGVVGDVEFAAGELKPYAWSLKDGGHLRSCGDVEPLEVR
jgi:hypothetical protein